MNVTEAVRELLLSMGPVTALVGTRIYVGRLPQSVTLPAIRLDRVDVIEAMHLRGPGLMQRARIQVDSVSLSGFASDAVDEAVHGDGITTGLRGWHGFIGASPPFQIALIKPITVRQGYDPVELKQYKVQRDFYCWYREP